MDRRQTIPPGIKCLRRFLKGENYQAYKISVLVITFFAYASFHASRKPPSIVKAVLLSSDNFLASSLDMGAARSWPLSKIFFARCNINLTHSSRVSSQKHAAKGWAPFNGESGTALLGQVDVAFLAAYAFAMFFTGHLAEFFCLRRFLSLGMIGSGLCVSLFGMGYWWKVHRFTFFIAVQMLSGFLQASGWPSVVTVVANWFGKNKRGLIMGIWNAHTSVGNILGSLMAASVLRYGWGWSFVLPGAILACGGLFVFMFLVPHPLTSELPSSYDRESAVHMEDTTFTAERRNVKSEYDYKSVADGKTTPLLGDEEDGFGGNEKGVESEQAVGFLQAWLIPGVLPFAMCLFFGKLVAYTFLYWLPFYIRHTEIQGHYFSDETAGNLSTIFDVGGVIGGIVAGHVSDKMKARAVVAASFTYASIPVLLVYRAYGSISCWMNVALLSLSGFFVNAPYALITTAISADLGTSSSLKGNARALATVTSIIDGTGSLGAALGPLVTGYISEAGWNSVFTMLMASGFVSGLLLTKLVIAEVREIAQRFKIHS